MYTVYTLCTLDPGGEMYTVHKFCTSDPGAEMYTVNTLCTLDPGWGDVQPIGGDISGAGLH